MIVSINCGYWVAESCPDPYRGVRGLRLQHKAFCMFPTILSPPEMARRPVSRLTEEEIREHVQPRDAPPPLLLGPPISIHSVRSKASFAEGSLAMIGGAVGGGDSPDDVPKEEKPSSTTGKGEGRKNRGMLACGALSRVVSGESVQIRLFRGTGRVR